MLHPNSCNTPSLRPAQRGLVQWSLLQGLAQLFVVAGTDRFYTGAVMNECQCSPVSGKEMVDYIADYLENIRSRRVFPDVSPGYMRKLVPDSAPEKGEDWEDIFNDIERVIMPGV